MFLSSSCFSSSQGRNIKREEGNRIVKRNDSSPVSKYFNYISGKDYDKVKKLTEKNPKLVNSKNKNGYTPLSMVLGINSRMAIYLIKKGADVNGKFGDFGHTPLHFTNDIEVARLLVKRGAKVNEKTSYGMTPLHIAASDGKKEICFLLIEHGAKTDENSEIGTPLIQAVIGGHCEIAKLLIEKGADINKPSKSDGKAPLHWAVFYGRDDIVDLLVKQGAGINIKDKKGKTPLYYVNNIPLFASNRKRITDILKKHGGK